MRNSLSDAQQYFLQIMINKKVIDQYNFKHIFTNVLNKFDIECNDSMFKEYYTNFLREINEVIKTFNMEIKTATCEISALTYFALIRQCDTGQIGTLSTLYSSMELKIFRKILELIIESEEGCVEYATIANEIIDYFESLVNEAATQSQTTKIPSTADIRQIVEKFMQDCWLVQVINRQGMITLHGRAIAELSQYIKQLYKDNDVLNYCYICKSLLLNGISCYKSECGCKMHRFCARNRFKKTSDCPSCRSTFTNEQIQDFKESINTARNVYSSTQSP